MNDLITGIVLAILAGSVVPFATAQASGWVESRRALEKRRRELYERALTVRNEMPPYVFDEPHAEREAKLSKHAADRNSAMALLRSSFGLFDDIIDRATVHWGTHVSKQADREIMRLWANGHRWTARWKARKYAPKIESEIEALKELSESNRRAQEEKAAKEESDAVTAIPPQE